MHCGNRWKARDESGQVLALATILMVVLIALTGFAIDVGHAYLVQRQLQAATDAAALAGALELPDSTLARQAAEEYGPEPAKRNALGSNDNATIDIHTKCVTSVPTGCTATNGEVNAISVDSTSNVRTVFAKIVGFDSFTVKARATACSPCSVKPLDIMLVLDRTGSMCQVTNPAYPGTIPGTNPPRPEPQIIPDPKVSQIDPATDKPYGNPKGCTDLTNAKDGIRTFLSQMNPQFHHVGLAVLPPVADASTQAGRCAAPTGYSTDAAYTLVGLSSDYASVRGNLNSGSSLMQTLDCLPSHGSTSYAGAITSAQDALTRGRTGVQKVLVFLSDGAANTGGTNPCAQGIQAARTATAAGTTVYAIGYDLNGAGTDYEQCSDATTITSYAAMQSIASAPDTFYNKPDPGQLNTIFTQIALDIFRTAQLIDDSLT